MEKGLTRNLSKDGLGGTLGNRYSSAKQYQKSDKKYKMEMKYIKKQNNIIFGMANLSDSRHELKKIKKIYAKAPKKHDYPRSDRSSSDSDS